MSWHCLQNSQEVTVLLKNSLLLVLQDMKVPKVLQLPKKEYKSFLFNLTNIKFKFIELELNLVQRAPKSFYQNFSHIIRNKLSNTYQDLVDFGFPMVANNTRRHLHLKFELFVLDIEFSIPTLTLKSLFPSTSLTKTLKTVLRVKNTVLSAQFLPSIRYTLPKLQMRMHFETKYFQSWKTGFNILRRKKFAMTGTKVWKKKIILLREFS